MDGHPTEYVQKFEDMTKEETKIYAKNNGESFRMIWGIVKQLRHYRDTGEVSGYFQK